MRILSDDLEREIKQQARKAIMETAEELKQLADLSNRRLPFITRQQLLKELGLSYKFTDKMERHGLEPIRLEPGDRTVIYRIDSVIKLLDSKAI